LPAVSAAREIAAAISGDAWAITACVSTWLGAGVPPTQVAAWAGHSVAVLLRTYAACLDGQEAAAKRRIEQSLRREDDPDERTWTRIRHGQP
jgi:hypothetical protein